MTASTHRQAGFSLIEAMVSIVIGLLVLAGFITVFMGSSSSYRKNDKAARLNDELSLAMAQLTEDIELAGYWGDLHDQTKISVDNRTTPSPAGSLSASASGEPTGSNVCFASGALAYTDLSAMAAIDNNTAASPLTCIGDANTGTASDILIVKRVNGSPTRAYDGTTVTGYDGTAATATPLTVNRVYLRMNGNFSGVPPAASTAGSLFRVTALTTAGLNPVVGVTNLPTVNADGTSSGSASYSDWEFRTSVYYVRNFSNAAGDNIPTLCRKTFRGGAPPTMVSECFGQGIESLQLEFGVDTGSDGLPDYYASANALTAAQIANACAVRIGLLGRSVNLATSTFDQFSDATADYKNTKTYAIGNLSTTVADSLFRRVVSNVVIVRNPTTLRVIGQ